MPALRKHMARFRAAEFSTMFEANGLPFAPITQPEDLFDDPHLLPKGGLADILLSDGRITQAPLLPLKLNKQRPGLRLNSPQLGEHTAELLAGLGRPRFRRLCPAAQVEPSAVDCLMQNQKAESISCPQPNNYGAAATKYIAVQAALKRFSCD